MIKEVRVDGADVTGVSARGCRRPTDCPSRSTGCHENHVPNSTTTTYVTTRPICRKQPMIKEHGYAIGRAGGQHVGCALVTLGLARWPRFLARGIRVAG